MDSETKQAWIEIIRESISGPIAASLDGLADSIRAHTAAVSEPEDGDEVMHD